jgi:hypothetical protein
MNNFTKYLEIALKLRISPFRVYAIHGKTLKPRNLTKLQHIKLSLVMAYLKESHR